MILIAIDFSKPAARFAPLWIMHRNPSPLFWDTNFWQKEDLRHCKMLYLILIWKNFLQDTKIPDSSTVVFLMVLSNIKIYTISQICTFNLCKTTLLFNIIRVVNQMENNFYGFAYKPESDSCSHWILITLRYFFGM